MRTRRGLVACLWLLLMEAATLAAQALIPQDGFALGWKRSGRPAVFIKADLFNHIDGGAELFLEFGFERLAVQRYALGKYELALEVYEMESPESALGVYLMKCGEETPVKGLRARNSGEASQLTILKNKYFVYVNNFSGEAKNLPAMVALASSALEAIPDVPAGRLLDQLPREGLVDHSPRLIRGPVALQPYYTFGEGDIFRLRGKIFAALADYQGEGDAGYTRLIIPYPDPKEALGVLEDLKAKLDPYLRIVDVRAAGFIFSDFKRKYGIIELEGSKLDIRFNLVAMPKF